MSQNIGKIENETLKQERRQKLINEALVISGGPSSKIHQVEVSLKQLTLTLLKIT